MRNLNSFTKSILIVPTVLFAAIISPFLLVKMTLIFTALLPILIFSVIGTGFAYVFAAMISLTLLWFTPFKALALRLLTGLRLSSPRLVSLSESFISRASAKRASLVQIDMEKCEIRNCDFSCSNLSEANLSESQVVHANLNHVSFVATNLMKATLVDVSMIGAKGNRARLKGARLENVDLRGADLSFANLKDANLEGMDLSQTCLKGAVFNTKTVLPFKRKTALKKGMIYVSYAS